MLPLLFSRRYLFSKKSHSVINIISAVSVFAVAMPVAAMIILLSVFNGFEGMVKSMTSTFDADLTATPRTGAVFAAERIDTAALRRIEGVEAFSFVLEQSAVLGYGDRQAAVNLRGADDAYAAVMPIAGNISAGEFRVRLGDCDRAVIGQGTAYTLGVRSLAAEPLKIYALKRTNFSTLLPLEGYTRRAVGLAGIFQLDAETEQQYALTSLRLARELFDYAGKASALFIKVRHPEQLQPTREAVQAALGDGFEVRTRYELRSTFYDIMTYEKWGIFFISLLVLIIASFSVVGALTMLIIEKRDETFTLRALGADSRFIRHIFLGEGTLICTLGALLGGLLGVGITLLQQHFGIVRIPAATAVLSSYPVELQAVDLVVVALAFAGVAAAVTGLTVYSMISKKQTAR